jgi:hypothetical protein
MLQDVIRRNVMVRPVRFGPVQREVLGHNARVCIRPGMASIAASLSDRGEGCR